MYETKIDNFLRGGGAKLKIFSCALVLVAAFAVLTLPQVVYASTAGTGTYEIKSFTPYNLGWDGYNLYFDVKYPAEGGYMPWILVGSEEYFKTSEVSNINGIQTFVVDLSGYAQALNSGAYIAVSVDTNSGDSSMADVKFGTPQRTISGNNNTTTTSTSSPVPTAAVSGDKYTKPSNSAVKAVFDAKYYAASYLDLAVYNGDEAKLLKHFRTYGLKEGHVASASFDVNAYRALYPDLQLAYGNDLGKYLPHYYKWGKKEGRIAHF